MKLFQNQLGGAHRDHEQIAARNKKINFKKFREFLKIYLVDQIFDQRKNRFLKIGRDQGFKKSSDTTDIRV